MSPFYCISTHLTSQQAFLKPFSQRHNAAIVNASEDLSAIEEPEDEEDIEARSQHTEEGIASDEQLLLEVNSEQTESIVEKVGTVREKDRREGVSMLTKVCYPFCLFYEA